MGIKVATGSDLKRTKVFIGYDPRTGKTHQTPNPITQENTMEPSGNTTEVKGTEAKEEGQKGEE